MKNLLLFCLLLAGCAQDKFAHPVAVVKQANVMRAGQETAVATVTPGDTVDLIEHSLEPTNSTIMVRLQDGKRGFVPTAALALPDSLRAKL